jgi:hypothetical protein
MGFLRIPPKDAEDLVVSLNAEEGLAIHVPDATNQHRASVGSILTSVTDTASALYP